MNRKIAKENEVKRNEFVSTQEIKTIKVSDIILTEPIHINAKVNFTRQIEKLQSKNIIMLNNPIIVKQESDSTYSLINGYKGYSIAKALNHEYVPAVVINESRKVFTKKLGFKSSRLPEGANDLMWLRDIRIPKEFSEKKVRREKVDVVMKYYNLHKEFDKPIVIKGKRLLIDGYARYVVAKILNIDRVPVKFEQTK